MTASTGKTVLVTVGSTQFAALSDAALSPAFMDALPLLGVAALVVQRGKAPAPAHIGAALAARVGDAAAAPGRARQGATTAGTAGEGEFSHPARGGTVHVRVLGYTSDAAEMDALIGAADIVVSHAGSGTILEVLRRPNPPALLVVPNPALMGNHQAELAEALEEGGYLAAGHADDLLPALGRLVAAPPPTPFPAPDPVRFASILDETMGFL